MKWLVPVKVETHRGRQRKVVPVEAEDEWEAQRLAADAVFWDARLGARSMSVDHAIPRGAKACGWGCCGFGR